MDKKQFSNCCGSEIKRPELERCPRCLENCVIIKEDERQETTNLEQMEERPSKTQRGSC